MTHYFIYTITNLVSGKIYVGLSKNVKARWNAHKSSFRCFARGGYCANMYIARSVLKYGVCNFSFKVIACTIDFESAQALEKYFIKELNTLKPFGYNLTTGGEGTPGLFMSAERKLQYSIVNSGSGNPFFGKKHSSETKLHLSEQKGIPVIIGETYYKSILDASKNLNLSRGSIYKMLRDGSAEFNLKQSNFKYLKHKPTREFRPDIQLNNDHHYIIAALFLYGSLTTTELISITKLHFEAVRKSIRYLKTINCANATRVKARYKGTVNLISLQQDEVSNRFRNSLESIWNLREIFIDNYERYSS